MKKCLAIFFISCTLVAKAQLNIVPQPVKAVAGTGTFQLSDKTVLVLTDEGEKASANFLNDYLQRFYGFQLQTAKEAAGNYIRLTTRKFIQPGTEGKYSLQVNPNSVIIEGDTYQGSFYGVQTLIQLLPVQPSATLNIPAVTIEDYPRFEYRGLHLDVCRHYMPLDFIKRYIDFIAAHKLNYFHWHLTEDQGWRIEIKKYPRLTSVGGWRNGTIIGRYPGKGNDNIRYGGFYTQDEVKEIVDYAAKRYVTVVPEIEMPGHASAAIAAYPWLSCFPNEKTKIPDNMISEASKRATGKLVQETWGVFDDVFCAGNDSTFAFLEAVLDEVIPLFPGPYVHVGGDECPKTHWKKCPKCQQRIKDLKLKDEHELQSYFIQRMEKYVNGKGKILIGWDEILEGGLAPNAIVMSWRGETGGIEAAKQNHKVIMTPGNYCYFDHTQTKNEDSVTIGGFTPLDEVYGYEPLPKELAADKHKYILGAQGNVWTEYIKNPSKVQYMIFPRLAALSEVLWTPKEKRDYKNFEKRLPAIFKRYDLLGINYSKAYYDIKASITPAPGNNGVYWTLQTNVPTPIKISEAKLIKKKVPAEPTGTNGQVVMKDTTVMEFTKAMDYKAPVLIKQSSLFQATNVLGGTKTTGYRYGTIITQRFSFNKATGKKITLKTQPSSSYPGNGGAFGLVNGAVSEKGISSAEWLGWSGPDMDATIDLGKSEKLSAVDVHTMEQNGGWIYLPASVEVFISKDGKTFTPIGKTSEFTKDNTGFLSGSMRVSFSPTTARYIKVIARNYGKIPEGKPGAGHPAWLFVDEIQVHGAR
ncbi:MAG TPA: family 20 glycosylhydrolase [Chitinophagaceae bacterium]|nr:family 20 glycosylhydrolase [Chitinophagaceae bacterium]